MEDTYRRTLDSDLADRLNQHRLQRGLTIRQAAYLARISRSHFGNLMTGRRAPSTAVAFRLIDTLALDPTTADQLLDQSVRPRIPDRRPPA